MERVAGQLSLEKGVAASQLPLQKSMLSASASASDSLSDSVSDSASVSMSSSSSVKGPAP